MLSQRSLLVFSSRLFLLRASALHTSSLLLAKKKVIQRFRLADIGEGITECEVIKWSVKPSSVIQSFDPLCEVQSDKASVEITSPFDGIVTELLVKEGDVAKVGEGLCLIEVEEDEAASVIEPSAPEAEAYPTLEIQPPLGQVSKQPASQPQAIARKPHPLDPKVLGSKHVTSNNILATPSVRHFAKQNGVDLGVIDPGSGKGGRILKTDIEAFLSAASSQPSMAPEDTEKELEVQLSRTRFAMWKAMTKSLSIPHFGYSTTLDLTRLSELLPILNSNIPVIYNNPPSSSDSFPPAISPHSIFPEQPAPPATNPSTYYTRLTFLPLLLKTLSRAMVEWPIFRSSITTHHDPSSNTRPTLTIRPHADIAIALSTPTGLYTPTITSVDTLSAYAIMGRLRRLQTLGRQVPSGLSPTDMPHRGATLTVSNVGAIGQGEFAAPVLVPGGGVAIVAIGRAKWVDIVPQNGIGASERRLVVGVSWSADHRIVEGAELAAFVETWRSWVENPERLIGDAI